MHEFPRTRSGARDAAFFLVGYAGALRVGELAALALLGVSHFSDPLQPWKSMRTLMPDESAQSCA